MIQQSQSHSRDNRYVQLVKWYWKDRGKMIGIELNCQGWDMDLTDHHARRRGNLNRNPYCSCSHSTPIPFWTMKRNEREGEMVVGGVEWRSGIWDCWWWLLLLCRCVCCLCVHLCAVIVFMLFVISVICLCFHVHTRTSTCIHVIDPLPPNTKSWFRHEKEWIMIW